MVRNIRLTRRRCNSLRDVASRTILRPHEELAEAVRRMGEAAHDADGFTHFLQSGVGLTL
ncbi:MAG: hypothetical protein OSA81_03760 [Longimicrobiales bacterium]|nr:hypothetical protein [Longimicrobiales bacterium]